MAETTLTAIIDRFQAVLEGTDVGLKKSRLPFSHDRQPNGAIEDRYYIHDDGNLNSQPLGNYKAARIDRLRVAIAKKTAFDGVAQFEAMETLLNTVEREIKADGLSNSYHAEFGGVRRVTQPDGKDLVIGEIGFTVDFDFAEAS
jgi:hypothetical protein